MPFPRNTSYLSLPTKGLPAPARAPPFLIFDIAINRYFPSSPSRSLTSLNLELHTLIEKSGTVFNLMGVAMSRVILIY